MSAKYSRIENDDLPPYLQGPTVTYSPENGGMFDITVYARLEYRRNGAENYLTDIEKREFEMLELDKKGKFEGSFNEQFPAPEQPVGHSPNPLFVSLDGHVDCNRIVLYAARSLENGSVTCDIPTFIRNSKSKRLETPIIVPLKWEIQDGIILLAKGGTNLFQAPISQLQELQASHMGYQAPDHRTHLSCCTTS
jgi:hypothetical protein